MTKWLEKKKFRRKTNSFRVTWQGEWGEIFNKWKPEVHGLPLIFHSPCQEQISVKDSSQEWPEWAQTRCTEVRLEKTKCTVSRYQLLSLPNPQSQAYIHSTYITLVSRHQAVYPTGKELWATTPWCVFSLEHKYVFRTKLVLEYSCLEYFCDVSMKRGQDYAKIRTEEIQ